MVKKCYFCGDYADKNKYKNSFICDKCFLVYSDSFEYRVYILKESFGTLILGLIKELKIDKLCRFLEKKLKR